MILSARFLTSVGSVNSFEYMHLVEFVEGDAVEIYLQLIDATKDRVDAGFKPSGRRYMPGAGATLQVIVDNIADHKKVERFATQPFPEDPSIWKLTIMPSDPIKGTASLKLTLVESGGTKRGHIIGALRVHPATNI